MKGKNLARLLVIFFTLAAVVAVLPRTQAQKAPAAGSPAGDSAAVFEKTVLPFLAQNCYQCHSSQYKSAGLDLEAFKKLSSVIEHREAWEHVAQKLRTGEMPPKGMPRPPQAEINAVVSFLEAEFERADRTVKPDPGRVTARRLNRAEYNNTVRDLLGVNFKPADDFPQDDSGYGFDNIGDVLSLSPVLMEKYLAAAEKIARTAVFGPEPVKPTLVRLRSEGRKIPPVSKPLFDYDVTGLSLPNALHATYRFPVEGEYNFRVFLGGNRPAASEPLSIALWVDGQRVQTLEFDPEKLASFEIDRQELGGKVAEMRAKVPGGEHWIAVSLQHLYEGLPPRYGGPNPSKRPEPPEPEFKPRPGLPPDRLEAFRKRFEEQRAAARHLPANDARVSSLEIAGPYNQPKGPSPESLKKIYVCGHLDGRHQAECDRQIIANLARRAFRRPVAAEEVNRLLSLVTLARKQGDSFEEGLVQAIQAMLVSPHFLFRIEQNRGADTADGAQPIGQYELASRLSYFLWSSMPDEELMQCAERGTLRQPEVLAVQVKRMLKDPKSEAFVENFAGQWLELRKLESVKPDRERFPQFDEYLRMSVRRETELFFDYIVREDRSVVDFIDANYTFLNERLAELYKIPGVKGPEFRRVVLSGETERGGILTQASVLTVSSYANRTSPVLRGKWILENILNAPPPPPPPGVPNLDESKVGSAASLRTQLEEHRKNPTCAACHSRMDPLGFGLENFDAIGAWRTMDGKFPIDASGLLPDGRTFKGPRELRMILKADRNAFAEGLTEKLLTYALGRGLERYDKPTVKEIVKRLSADNYRFSSLVFGIVESLPFQMRRGEKNS